MARTSTRRWKGCAMCKDHKIAGHGDSYRQPAQVAREMGSDRRWNRHDLPGDTTKRGNRKKDRKRWCRGKPGREHQWVPAQKWGKDCLVTAYWPNGRGYSVTKTWCREILRCQVCGREEFIPERECKLAGDRSRDGELHPRHRVAIRM